MLTIDIYILFIALFVLNFNTIDAAQVMNIPDGKVSFIFLGDTSFGENYQEQIEKYGGENILTAKGYQYSLKKFTAFLEQAEFVIANLETPVTDLAISPLKGKKDYLHWSDLTKTPKALYDNNIRIVSLANNHSLDFGVEGLEQTFQSLKKFNIQCLGAGVDEESAAQPLKFNYLLNQQPLQLVIAAGFEYRKKYEKEYYFYSGKNKAGTNAWTIDRATVQLKEIRLSNPKAIVVAYPHFGKNYAWKTKEQTALAHALIDAGADIVIGHGAHVMQEIEQYNGRWIIYNLGNFVFNAPGRYKKKKIDPFSLIAKLDVSQKNGNFILKLRLYPIFSDNRITHYQPYFVDEKQFYRVKELLLQQSSDNKLFSKYLHDGKDVYGYNFELILFSKKIE